MTGDIPVTRAVAYLDARVVDGPWPWAESNRAVIADHWAGLVADKPSLFNGRVLLRTGQDFAGDTLKLSFRETDYASFLALRDMGWPDPDTGNAFAMAAVRSADGAFILGEMANHTANAGQVYFPAGTPDPSDVLPDGRVDLAGSVWRELAEETGLGPEQVGATGRWMSVRVGPRTALMCEMVSDMKAAELLKLARAHLAAQATSELSAIHAFRDIHGDAERALLVQMPAFMSAYLSWAMPRAASPHGRPGDAV